MVSFSVINFLKDLALVVGFVGGLPRLIEALISPNLKIDKVSISRYNQGDQINHDTYANFRFTELKWNIVNAKRLGVFGRNALQVETHWNVAIKGKEDKWVYKSKNPEKVSFLYVGQEWPQKIGIDDYFPDEDYIINFQITSQGKANGSANIPYPKEKLKI